MRALLLHGVRRELRVKGVSETCPLCRSPLPPGREKLFDLAIRVWMKMSYTRGIQNNPKGNIDLWYLSAAQQWGGMKAAIVMAQEAMDQVSARAIC